MLGQVLDRYRLVERLGGGELGEVFKGQHPTLEHSRAVRVLPPRVSQDAELVARLVLQARRCAALNHPNIVRLEHLGEQEGRYFLVTDYVPGHSLRELIDTHGPLPAERAIRVARQICAALAYAHEQGMVHGDIRPSNILVGEEDHAMLADFGACWRVGEGASAGEGAEVPEYLSPEQIRDEEPDGRSDLYSLGVALYEAVTGELPFMARSKANVKRQQLQQAPLSPRFYNPETPAALEHAILKALAKRPRDRFADAAQFELALSQALEPVATETASAARLTAEGQPAQAAVSPETGAETKVGTEREPAPAAPVRGAREASHRPAAPVGAAAAPPPRPAPRDAAQQSPPRAGGDVAHPWRQALADWSGQSTRWLSTGAGDALRGWIQKQKVALGAAATVICVCSAVLLLQNLGNAGAGGRFTAERSLDPVTGKEIGTVRAHSVPILVITQASNGLPPGERAELAALRLERLLAGGRGLALEPEQLDAVHNSAGELVLARRADPGAVGDPRPEDVVVTVDAATATGYARANRTSLALWWRDVLRDQIRLAQGQPPLATRDTSYGRVLDRMQQQVHLKKRGGWVPAAEIRRALNGLSASQREDLNEAWRTVPAAWGGGKPAAASAPSPGPTMVRGENAFASDAAPGTSAVALIDNDPATVWQSRQGTRHRGERHWLKIALGDGARVSRLEVREGTRGNPQQQLRIKQAKATFSDGSMQRLWRQKPTDPLRISMAPRASEWVKLEVEQVFANRRRNASRLCVSEVRLWEP